MTIAEQLKAYRQRPPYPSVRKIAAQLGISRTYVSEIERGIKIPRGSILEKLATLLGTTVEQLNEPRILQISAAAVDGHVRVACLMSDGSLQIAYPEDAVHV